MIDSRPKILNLDPQGYCEQAKAILCEVAEVFEQKMSADELRSCIHLYDVVMVRFSVQVDSDLIGRASRLRAIVTNATGVDHIDIETAARRNIQVISLKGETQFLETISATAELTWGLISCIARKMPAAFTHVCGGGWDRERFIGSELSGKKLGVLGLGRLGRKVVKYGLAFDMEVGGYDTDPARYLSTIKMFSDPQTLFGWADILTIHIPLNDNTHNFLDRNLLTEMKYGAWLINTSRGQLLDESALLDLLESGHIGAAALDVLADELRFEDLKQHPLIKYASQNQNLLITPHIGGATRDSWEKTEIFIAKKLSSYLSQQT